MVKTIIEETAAVSLLSTDLTLVWQPSQTPHTRQASMTQVLTSMAGLPANFTSVTTPSGTLVVGPTTAQFNALSTVVSTTTTSMSTSQTQLTDLENRVAVLESGGTLTGITINGIADQNTGVTFVVSGSLIGYASAPTLQYRDNAGAFVSLPGAATVTASSYSFTHPSVGTATGGMTVTVRDSVATTVTATSNSFAIVSAAAGAPDPPTLPTQDRRLPLALSRQRLEPPLMLEAFSFNIKGRRQPTGLMGRSFHISLRMSAASLTRRERFGK